MPRGQFFSGIPQSPVLINQFRGCYGGILNIRYHFWSNYSFSPTTASPLLTFLGHKDSQIKSITYPLTFSKAKLRAQWTSQCLLNLRQRESWIFDVHLGFHRILGLSWNWLFPTSLIPGVSCLDTCGLMLSWPDSFPSWPFGRNQPWLFTILSKYQTCSYLWACICGALSPPDMLPTGRFVPLSLIVSL